MPQLAQQELCIGEILIEVGPANLHVDRSRRAEIENLADDIGRQEREAQTRKFTRQFIAHSAHITCRRGVPLVERDLNVAV